MPKVFRIVKNNEMEIGIEFSLENNGIIDKGLVSQ
jgi:hypothetical protein